MQLVETRLARSPTLPVEGWFALFNHPVIRQQLAAEAGALISALWIGSAVGTVIMLLIGRRMQPAHALAVMTVGVALVAAGIGWWATVAASVLFGTGYGIAAAVFNPRVLKAYADRGPAMVSLPLILPPRPVPGGGVP